MDNQISSATTTSAAQMHDEQNVVATHITFKTNWPRRYFIQRMKNLRHQQGNGFLLSIDGIRGGLREEVEEVQEGEEVEQVHVEEVLPPNSTHVSLLNTRIQIVKNTAALPPNTFTKSIQKYILDPLLEDKDPTKTYPTRGVLMYGPHGVGKTYLLQLIKQRLREPEQETEAAATKKDCHIIHTNLKQVLNYSAGSATKYIQTCFRQAMQAEPCLLIFDGFEVLGDEESSSTRIQMITACVDTISNEMDTLHRSSKQVVVVGVCIKSLSIPNKLKTFNRFESDIIVTVPNENVRAQIIRTLLPQVARIDTNIAEQIAKLTPGRTPADLASICWQAENMQDNEVQSDDDDPMDDNSKWVEKLKIAVKNTPPSSARSGSLASRVILHHDLPKEDVVGPYVNEIMKFLNREESVKEYGVPPLKGILLYGPPGCGKTAIAKHLARTDHRTFISVKGPELFHPHVGQTEKNIRDIFEQARRLEKCIIFFDEFESLVPTRTGGNSGGQGVSNRAVGTFLTELDGIHKSRGNVLVLAATNEKNQIDPAVLRPGRFDIRIEVKPPQTIQAVHEILRSYICTLTNKLDPRLESSCKNGSRRVSRNYVDEITRGITVDSRAKVSGAALVNAVNNGIREVVSQGNRTKTSKTAIKKKIKKKITDLYAGTAATAAAATAAAGDDQSNASSVSLLSVSPVQTRLGKRQRTNE
jgi:SpoVK/Ycf46/Vps4 family AAA+-type ATPase